MSSRSRSVYHVRGALLPRHFSRIHFEGERFPAEVFRVILGDAMSSSTRCPVARFSVRVLAVIACAAVVPRYATGRGAAALYRGDADAQRAFAAEVTSYVRSGVAASAFRTGNARFDGEWAFGTFAMAALGLGHVAVEHPETRDAHVPVMETCADELRTPATNAFGTEAWGDFGFDGLPGGRGHAYLGYSNLALSMLRLVHPATRHAKLNDDLTEALARRLAESPHGLFETYPGESYPPDVAMVAGSIALHDCATGAPPRAFLPAWKQAFSRWIDPASGLLHQAGLRDSGDPAGPPRSSGTALAAFALSFLDEELSKRLFEGLSRARSEVLGFSAIREYAPGHEGPGDIDSGPVLLGVSVSATGFSLSSARLHGDHGLYTGLYRTAVLFGVPVSRGGGERFMSGGPLGNAILLAMTSASWSWRRHCKKVAP